MLRHIIIKLLKEENKKILKATRYLTIEQNN
jgi:hypothetical protein